MGVYVKFATIFTGVVAGLLLYAATLLLFFYRELVEVTGAIVSTPEVVAVLIPPTSPVLFPGIANVEYTTKLNLTPITIVIEPFIPVDPSITPPPPPPEAPPSTLDFLDTFDKPLQRVPQGFGNAILLSDGTQLISSLRNGYLGFAQYVYDGVTAFETPNYPVTQNRILINYTDQELGTSPLPTPNNNCLSGFPSGTGNPVCNIGAANVGSVGTHSIEVSDDELRLYVAYIDPNISKENPFPFQQVAGKIQVFSRSPGALSNTNNDQIFWSTCSTDVKTRKLTCNSILSNPFGSQTVGIDSKVQNSFTLDVARSGDQFGGYIRTSTNSTNRKRMVAASANFGTNTSEGRIVSVFEEDTEDISYRVVGILQLPQPGTPLAISFEISDTDYTSFATSFDLVNDTCLVGFGGHSTSPATDKHRRLANFRRNEPTQEWEFIDVIDSPAASPKTEYFATSVRLSPEGDWAFIGSPAINPTVSSTGHVYSMLRGSDNIWALKDTVKDKYPKNSPRTFGWFVDVDRSFRFLTVSSNQDSVYSVKNEKVSTDCSSQNGQGILPNTECNAPAITIFTIDRTDSTIETKNPNPAYLFQNSSDLQDVKGNAMYVDPLFGAKVDISGTTDSDGNQSSPFRLVASSPMNEFIGVWTTKSS
jgi:hypothetical protein